MSAIVFLGPSLPIAEARAALAATYLPPAAAGDIMRAVAQRPRAIGLIDGQFQSAPSVRHKEILWALAQGIHVFGAASMGALRAAELHPFGMVGIGEIFAAYRDGRIDDDDEVAVSHGPLDVGFAPLCEPMVNVRWTLLSAARAGIISSACADRLILLGKDMFYPERNYDRLLQSGAAGGLPRPELDALRAWLPRGRIDQKRADALVLLRSIGDFLAGDPPPFVPAFRFESSEIWDEESAAARVVGAGENALPVDTVLDELRLVPGEFAQVRQKGLGLALALREARREGHMPDGAEIAAAERALRDRHGIGDRRQFECWLADNDLDEQGLTDLLACQARHDRIDEMASDLANRRIVDVLRLTGQYAALARRARRKRTILQTTGADPADPTSLGQSTLSLTLWFFSQRLAGPAPSDMGAFAAAQGFADTNAFFGALLAEYLLWREDERSKDA